jgi:hypothetical protein
MKAGLEACGYVPDENWEIANFQPPNRRWKLPAAAFVLTPDRVGWTDTVRQGRGERRR